MLKHSGARILGGAIVEILPASVKLELAAIDEAQGALYANELHYVRDAVDKRRKEFTAGRVCSRRALARLGISPCSIPAGVAREPIWPRGISGSITHDGDHCIVAVAYESDIPLLGIDLTTSVPLDRDLVKLICTKEDVDHIADLGNCMQDVDLHKLIFSIKESTFKCLFPVVRTVFDFQDVSIHLDVERQAASIRLLSSQLLSKAEVNLRARYCVAGSYIFSVVWV